MLTRTGNKTKSESKTNKTRNTGKTQQTRPPTTKNFKESISLLNNEKPADSKQNVLKKNSEIKKVKPTVSNDERLVNQTNDLTDDEEDENNEMFDSRLEAANIFKKMIHPVKTCAFFKTYWEKKPMLIKRTNRNYYNNWFSCKEFDHIMKMVKD